MPGAAVATMSSAPRGHQALRDPAHAVVLEVLEQGVVGGEGAGPRRRRPRRRSPAGGQHDLVVVEVPAGRTGRPARSCPRPRRSGRDSPAGRPPRARAALTVVLPTPPFPATMTTPGCCEELRRIQPVPFGGSGAHTSDVGSRRCAHGSGDVPPASGGPGPGRGPDAGLRRVLEVSGLIDPVIVRFVDESIDRCRGPPASSAVVLELNIAGVVVPTRSSPTLVERIVDSPIPVSAWVGHRRPRRTGRRPSCSRCSNRARWRPDPAGRRRRARLDPGRFGDVLGDAAIRVADG